MRIPVYLAGPITSENPGTYLERIRAHAHCALELEKNTEYSVYSPACETHGFVELGGKIGTKWEDWRDHDLAMLAICKKLVVAMIPGWKESRGVRGEVKFALKNKIPIEFTTPEGDCIIETNVLEIFDVKSEDELND